jgi:hypothetical protein
MGDFKKIKTIDYGSMTWSKQINEIIEPLSFHLWWLWVSIGLIVAWLAILTGLLIFA